MLWGDLYTLYLSGEASPDCVKAGFSKPETDNQCPNVKTQVYDLCPKLSHTYTLDLVLV